MINTRYSSQQILTLFGRRAEGQAQHHAQATSSDRLKAVADLAKLAGSKVTQPVGTQEGIGADLPIVLPEGHVLETREQYEAKLAKAEAEMAIWEAKEQAFEKENGFRRQVNSMLQGAYAHAVSGRGGESSFQSHKEAQDFASAKVSSVWGQLVTANRNTNGLATPRFVAGTAEMEGIRVDQAEAMLKDGQQAAQMNMLIEGMMLNKSLEVSGGPLYAKQDGYYHMNNVEVRYGGKLVLTVEEHGGKITLYDEDGTARDPGQMHQIERNQPGAYTRTAAS
ncbi:hypothetical protein FHG66_20680 [Rubellimicrobium rubrum]|uniref:Uncharacterized protein n=1 Tax=Rubellimicrobium rubrum TaxID=2585369 RepID=A0A5C4MLL9_9RHOB|nr:hypothetical protein [Rubellimicrobium rubrum]TNC44248.1 hypothetical protein FHG66_20680 [Rubellimicrobium rubrum]